MINCWTPVQITATVAQKATTPPPYSRNNRRTTSNQPWRQSSPRSTAPINPYMPQQWSSFLNSPQPPRVKCQVCDKIGHVARVCWSRSHNHFEAKANFVSTSHHSQHPWIMDTRATHHVTTESQGFQHPEAYYGTDEISLGDGNKISNIHTGTINLSASNNQFQLPHTLCAPQIKQKLIYVSQFCQDNLTSIEFFPSYFFLKDLSTGALLVRGQTNNGLYEWPCGTKLPHPHINSVSKSPSKSLWHRRLDHPKSRVLQTLFKNFSLPFSGSNNLDFFHSCSCNKSHRPLFTRIL